MSMAGRPPNSIPMTCETAWSAPPIPTPTRATVRASKLGSSRPASTPRRGRFEGRPDPEGNAGCTVQRGQPFERRTAGRPWPTTRAPPDQPRLRPPRPQIRFDYPPSTLLPWSPKRDEQLRTAGDFPYLPIMTVCVASLLSSSFSQHAVPATRPSRRPLSCLRSI